MTEDPKDVRREAPSGAPDAEAISRRNFLVRAARAGIAIAAAGALGYGIYDGEGPKRESAAGEGATGLPDFSIPGMTGKMSIAHGSDRAKLLQAAVKPLGGMEAFIKKGDRVLVKVNAAFATPAVLCATTHPELLSEIVRLCFQAGAASVVVTDNPINDPESCFALTGIAEAAKNAGAVVMPPREQYFHRFTLPGGKLIKDWPLLRAPFEGVDKVIGAAPLKDHHRSGASMTMKNWYGLLGGRRNVFHQDVHTIITELAMMVKPSLVILDGVTAMMTNGPTGGSLSDLKPTGMMIAGTDQVAVDAFGAELLDRSASDLPFLLKAEAAGVGSANYKALNPFRVDAG